MTKKELKQAMIDFINRKDNTVKEESYCTDRDWAESIIKEFAEDLNIDLGELNAD